AGFGHQFIPRIGQEVLVDFIEGDIDRPVITGVLYNGSHPTLHSDVWYGSAAALADMHTIAIYPVGGWWKYRAAQDRWENSVRYSLVVSIEVPDETIDIYSVVESIVQTQIEIQV
ncbi:phage baseplate assembly protein V, partial [Chromobacterium amazonense]|uniref:phage baseplate assembly protein V n=1 Tax=Chromobacterium amazonense TaxID=1382803 RepID=UPI00237E16D0